MLKPLRKDSWVTRNKIIPRHHSCLEADPDPDNVPIDDVLDMYAQFLNGCTRVEALVLPREWVKEESALSQEDRAGAADGRGFRLRMERRFTV